MPSDVRKINLWSGQWSDSWSSSWKDSNVNSWKILWQQTDWPENSKKDMMDDTLNNTNKQWVSVQNLKKGNIPINNNSNNKNVSQIQPNSSQLNNFSFSTSSQSQKNESHVASKQFTSSYTNDSKTNKFSEKKRSLLKWSTQFSNSSKVNMDNNSQNWENNSFHKKEAINQWVAWRLRNSNTSEQTNTRFLQLKYKIFVFFLLIAVILFYPYVISSYNSYQTTLQQVKNVKNSVQSTIDKRNTHQNDDILLDWITQWLKANENQKQPPLISCINQDVACDELNNNVRENLDIIRIYTQLRDLRTKKMEVNEKTILKNVNEFLLQKDPFSRTLQYNGELQSLNIGSPKHIKWQLYETDVSFQIVFPDKSALIVFLEHVEDELFYHPTFWFAWTIMYKIQNLEYDIVEYNDEQEVWITMKAYRYESNSVLF